MTAATHMASGALIGLAVKRPELALPLAFLSHFALDIMPHFGYDRGGYGVIFKHKVTLFVAAWDVAAWIILLWFLRGASWWAYVAGIAAGSPDLAWPYRYFRYERRHLKRPKMPLSDWHSRIQVREYPWGNLIIPVWY